MTSSDSVKGARVGSAVGSRVIWCHFSPGIWMCFRRKPRGSGASFESSAHSAAETRRSAPAQLAEPTHVVLVQVREDGRVDVARRVPERRELRGERVLLAHLEPSEAIVEETREATGKYEASVTDARSCPVSNRTSPLECSMTYDVYRSAAGSTFARSAATSRAASPCRKRVPGGSRRSRCRRPTPP